MMRRSVSLGLAVLVFITAGCGARRANLNAVFVVGEDDRMLQVLVASCNADLTTQIEESDTEVVITVTVRNDTTDACEDVLRPTLSEPLGERAVIDGSTGRAMEVRRSGQ